MNNMLEKFMEKEKKIGSLWLHMATVEVTLQWKRTVEISIDTHKCLHHAAGWTMRERQMQVIKED